MEPVHPTDPPPTPAPDAAPPNAPTLESLRAARAKAEAALRGQRELAEELEQRLEATLEELTAGLQREADEELQKRQAELAAEIQSLQQDRASWESERDAVLLEITQNSEEATREAEQIQAERAEIDQQLAELTAREQAAEQLKQQLDARQRELDEHNTQLNARQAELLSGGDQLLQEAARRHEQELASLSQTHANQLAELQAQLAAAQQENKSLHADLAASSSEPEPGPAPEQLEQLEQQVQTLRGQLAQTETSLAEVNSALAEAQASLAAAQAHDNTAELQALQQRFELAVSDAQQHRLRIDQLEQELAARPAMDQGDSAEVVHLRAECDALRDQIAELQAAPRQQEGSEEELAELQRRFEMAVEDVRELKREKARLEERLLATPAASAAPEGGNDWEAQKRRLLASLEGESETHDLTPERADEIATIEGTIKITDEVICGKDDVIADLRRQLKEATAAASEFSSSEFTDDERLEVERTRLRALEEQLKDKLRQTELELSVERAKIARQRAEMEQKMIDLEAARVSMPPRVASVDGNGKRQSNWLKKLGLGGDDE